MKTVAFLIVGILFSVFSSSAASFYGTNPLPRSNWSAVDEHLEAIHEIAGYTMMTIYIHVLAEDGWLGAVVGQKLNEAAGDAVDLLIIVKDEIKAETLTVDMAKQHLEEMFVVFRDMRENIQEDLDQLSEITNEYINLELTTFNRSVPGIADRLYWALDQYMFSCGLLGIFPNATISPDTPLDAATLPGTVIWNATLFEVAQAYVIIHPHNKYLDSEITEASRLFWIQTTLDFPNFIDDTNYTSIHRGIMFQCNDGSNIAYDFEFPLVTE